MFTKNKNPRVSYLSRLLALPLAAIIFFAFTLKTNPSNISTVYDGKKITVIIDAGHGGSDNGVRIDNTNEKDVTLSIAKYIKALNTNKNVNIILSRTDDQYITPKDRVKFAEENKADLFISIHTDNVLNNPSKSGMYIFIPKDDNGYLKESKILASSIVQSLKNINEIPVTDDLQQREKGIFVLKANTCPAILIETGFLSSQKDLNYLSQSKNLEIIARDILNGIESYAEQNTVTNDNKVSAVAQNIRESAAVKDSVPNPLFVVDGKITSPAEAKLILQQNIESINVLKEGAAVALYGEKGKNGVIEIKRKNKNEPNLTTVIVTKSTTKAAPIYLVDGKELSKDDLDKIEPSSINSISVLKGQSAINKYGKKAENGAIEITLKPVDSNTVTDTMPDKVFTKVEQPASFPGGSAEWVKYITKIIQTNLSALEADKKNTGTCVVKFIVNTDGTINNVEATTMKGTQLADIAVNALKKSPKWIPGKQNDHIVASYIMQPVSFKISDDLQKQEPK